MSFALWCAVLGLLFGGMALLPNRIEKWFVTTSIIYLGVGLLLGPLLIEAIRILPLEHSKVLERLTEVVVLISLFAAGLKLRLPFSDRRWWIPLRLALLAMLVTIGLLTLTGVYVLHLPLGAAMLLGAILAPTDPVLASEVQVEHTSDEDRLRFSLTGEAGLNDGAAFPFVLLGLGLLGQHDIGAGGWKWLAVDVLWSIGGGLALGAALGIGVTRLVIYLRACYHEAVGLDDFLALSLIAGTYGVALLLHTSGFLAVFAAGLALRHTERAHTEQHKEKQQEGDGDKEGASQSVELPADDEGLLKLREEVATSPDRAAGFMARAILNFNEALEHIAELGLVVLLGAMLTQATWTNSALWLAPLLFLVIRPVSTFIGLLGTRNMGDARPFIAWFGIRGIGSLYYLFYAARHGLSPELAQQFLPLVFSIVAISILVHGVTVTPLMALYNKRLDN